MRIFKRNNTFVIEEDFDMLSKVTAQQPTRQKGSEVCVKKTQI